MTRKWIAVPALALPLWLAGCGGEEKKEPAGREARTPVQLAIGHVGHDHQIALGLAALRPEATKEACGIHLVERKPREVYDLHRGGERLARFLVKKVGGGSNMPAAMEKGALDIGFGGIPAVIKFIDKGNDFRILCPLNVDGDMLLARPDLGVENWEQFVALAREGERPLRVGVKNIMSVAKLVCHEACLEAGIGEKVEFVNLKSNKNVIPTLQTAGTVDAVATNEPVCTKAILKGVARKVSLLADLPPAGRFEAHPCCCICATGETIRDHREVLQAFITLMKCCTGMINADKEEAARVGAAWTRAPLEVEQASIPNIVYKIEPDPAYRRGLEQWYKNMKRMGVYRGDLAGLPFPRFFEKVHDLSFIEGAGR
mgnify:CR=1 FL=1